jgi:nicotinic acid phosphoribosyltransferase
MNMFQKHIKYAVFKCFESDIVRVLANLRLSFEINDLPEGLLRAVTNFFINIIGSLCSTYSYAYIM